MKMESHPRLERALFAAGCFWGVEYIFSRVPGVVRTTVGYTGGKESWDDPTYEQVKTGLTLHAEAVLVEYDPQRVSYAELLNYFWRLHDPTQLNRQGADIGTQYRSAIFTFTAEQARLAQQSKRELEAKAVFDEAIVTEILAAGEFYVAEEYHQKYFQRVGGTVCHFLRSF